VEHREGFAMITGEVGTGKTTALFRLIEGMERHYEIAFLTNSTLTAVELLEEICRKFRIEVDRELTKPALLSRLEAYLVRLHEMGHGAVLIIDEAQNFDHLLLEEVRLLSNVTRPGGTPLLQIALIGQPELERKLSLPELRQLKQRIGVHYRIEPLSAEETGRYIHHRVTVAGGFPRVLFPPDTLSLLHERTHGLPREINQVASQSLLHAYVEESTSVRKDHVLSAIEEMDFRSVLERGMTLTVAPNPGMASNIGLAASNPGPATNIGMAMPRPGPPNIGKAAAPASEVPNIRRAAGEPPPARRAEPPPASRAEATEMSATGSPATEEIAGTTPRARFWTEPIGGRGGQSSRSRHTAFGALAPVGSPAEGSTEVRNPIRRRLLIMAGGAVILIAAGLLLFAPAKSPVEGVAEMESEPTLPSAPASNRDRPAGPLPGALYPTSPGSTGPGTSTTAKSGGTSTPAPAITSPPPPVVQDPVVDKPVTAAAPASLRGYYLQVASFRDSAIAEDHGRALARRSGHVHRVERSGSGESPWYAVYIGPFQTTAEAESGRVELSRFDRSLASAIVRDRR
jgi:type II secretory pathway predicted ATPase ExeA